MSVQPMYSPTSISAVQPMALGNGVTALNAEGVKATALLQPGIHAVLYETELRDNARCIGCTVGNLVPNWAVCMAACPLCWCCVMPYCIAAAVRGDLCANFCCYKDKLHPRSYVRIYENRLESNYAKATCWGCCVYDDIYVRHFDLPERRHARLATSCTPFHCCCCIPCASPVVAIAPSAGYNTCWCNCCREFLPAMPDAGAFLQAYELAQSAWIQKGRFGPGAFAKANDSHQMVKPAPQMIQMA